MKRLDLFKVKSRRWIGDESRSGGESEIETHNIIPQPQASEEDFFAMNSTKRQRSTTAPVSKTSSVNYKTVNRTITLSGREFISDIESSVAFASFSRLLRPTDSMLFSWLSGIARKFEEFKFSSLKFFYEPQCSSATGGQVALFFDGDPTHIAPSNWNAVINTGANAHTAVWNSVGLSVPKWLFASRASYYTLPEFDDVNKAAGTPLTSPTDPYEYFPGIYGWCVEGHTGVAGTIGKLYMEYTVSFKTQNVDGYAVTNTLGASVSGEEVINSGFGYHEKLSSFPPGGGYVLGGPADYTYAHKAGNLYFRRASFGNVKHTQIVQNVTLLLSARSTGAAPMTLKVQAAPNVNGAPGAYVDCTALTFAAAGVAIVDIESEPAANDRTQVIQVRMRAGSFIRIHTAVEPTFCQLTWSPFAYPLVS